MITIEGTFRHLWGYHDEVLEDLKKVAESKTASKELRASAYVKLGSQTAMQDTDEFDEYFKRAEMIYPECVDIYHQKGNEMIYELIFHLFCFLSTIILNWFLYNFRADIVNQGSV